MQVGRSVLANRAATSLARRVRSAMANREVAREAMRLAAHKLPLPTKFVVKEGL